MYAIIWRFEVAAGAEEEFELRYGPDGAWARLFGRSSEYVRTDLLKDGATYVTIDWWRSLEEYEALKRSEEYLRLDRECEPLTIAEEKLGQLRAMP